MDSELDRENKWYLLFVECCKGLALVWEVRLGIIRNDICLLYAAMYVYIYIYIKLNIHSYSMTAVLTPVAIV